MKTFQDNSDPPHVWNLAITVGAIKRVKSLASVDLGRPDEGDPPLLTTLQMDVSLMCDVIFSIVHPQAVQLNVTDEQFAETLLGDGFKNACEAFWAEWRDFFQKLGQVHRVVMLDKATQLMAAAQVAATKQAEAIDVETQVQTAFASATSGPASSESIPTT